MSKDGLLTMSNTFVISSDSEIDEDEKPGEVFQESDSDSYEDEVIDEKEKTDVAGSETLVELQTEDEKMTSSVQVASSRGLLPPQPRRKRFIPKYDVEGVHIVTLSEETMIQIEMVIGLNITPQYPWKLISRDKIMETIEIGGELSEFFPLKEALEEYKEPEILMGYIVDESKDTDEFYVCCTVEARDHCKAQSDRFIRRQEKKLEKAMQKKPRPWKSLGSEVEIKELNPITSRTLMELEIKTKFPPEYQIDRFKVRDSASVRDGYIELTPYRQKFNNVFRRRIDTASQACPVKESRHAQTSLKYPSNKWTQTVTDTLGPTEDTEGGGDAKAKYDDEGNEIIDDDEDESDEDVKEPVDDVGAIAYKKAMQRMRRTSYVKRMNSFMLEKCKDMEAIVELNTVMDIYGNDYPQLVAQKTTGVYDSMTFEEYVCFTDVRAKDKYVSSAVFHPMWTGIVAICYADASPSVMKILSTRPDPIYRAVYGMNPVMIWSHIDSLIPKLYLESPREVKVLSFCPFNENILLGGCINGQIVIWDLLNKLINVEKLTVLSEKREKYRIAMNVHMGWMKSIQDNAVVPSTALSNLQNSHYGSVNAINWLSPNFSVTPTGKAHFIKDQKKSMMFFTGSDDGRILIWNLSVENVSGVESKKVKKSKRVLRRPSGLMLDFSPFKVLDRTFTPIYKLILGVAGQQQVFALQSMGMNPPIIEYTFDPTITGLGRKYFTCSLVPEKEKDLKTILYCGSQHGKVKKFTWEGHEFNTGEAVNSEYCDTIFNCEIHDGIVTCTKPNPFITEITMTVGGKIFAIWSDKLNKRPLLWKKRLSRLTDAAWSLYKPSLVFIATSEGNLETWDLLLRSDQPISVQTLSGSMLTGVSLHTLPLAKNMIGVSDVNGSFRMFLDPAIFMIENESYKQRMENMIARELKVMQSFLAWQNAWMKLNPHILLEIKRKEGALLAEKAEERQKLREQEEKRLEDEAEARRIAKMRVIGPEERWKMIIQKLIERTIAVKKRINRAELLENEKPLRELETQRLEKERRMFEIMKNQKTIFNDTVAILFPEAITKSAKEKKSYLSLDLETLKKEYLDDYEYLKKKATKTVENNRYRVEFSWEATLAEGKERRQSLNLNDDYIKMHRKRLEREILTPRQKVEVAAPVVVEKDDDEPENEETEENV